jgi:cobalt/nickel transport system permease protein
MHIPDGYLDLKTSVSAAVLAAGGVGWAIRVAGRQVPPARRPLMGLAAAFIFAAQMINFPVWGGASIFAAQMINFPVWGGASGHLIGGVLAASGRNRPPPCLRKNFRLAGEARHCR